MGPTWVLSAPDEPHVGPMNVAIMVLIMESPFAILAVSVTMPSLHISPSWPLPSYPSHLMTLPTWLAEQLLDILTHLPLDKMVAISQTTFSNAFSWMKSFVFWFEFHWSLFLRVQLTICQHWFRKWPGADLATSHYLNQCWPSSPTHICGTRGRWVKGQRGGVILVTV